MSKLEEIQYKIKMLKKMKWYKDKSAKCILESWAT